MNHSNGSNSRNRKSSYNKAFKYLAFLLTCCAIVISGCGKSTPPEGVGESERIIRLAEQGTPVVDPAVGSDVASAIAFANIYDTLVFPDNDGSCKPWLAESWKTSDDGLSWEFFLRKGVKFHSGNELKAEDVVFSFKRLIDIGEGYAYMFIGKVDQITATGDYSLEIKLTEPYGPFLSTLARMYVLEKAQIMDNLVDGPYGDMKDYGKNWLLANDAGSGPYVTDEIKVQESYRAVRFDDFWGGWTEDAPDGFEIVAQTQAATVRTMMNNRELDISDMFQTKEGLEALEQIEGVDLFTSMSGSLMYMMMNTQAAPTDDLHFRKALSHCLDYEVVAKNLFPGSAAANGPVSSALAGWNSALPTLKRDMELAQEELSKSVYADKLDQYTVKLIWIAEVPDEEKLALLLQSNANELGIDIEIETVPWTSFVDLISDQSKTPNISIVHVDPHYDEAGSILDSKYHSRSMGTWEQAEWLNNSEIDAAIDDAIRTIDYEERINKYHNIQEMIVDLAPSIWAYDIAERRAYQDYIIWPSMEAHKRGEPFTSVMGYQFYFHDFGLGK